MLTFLFKRFYQPVWVMLVISFIGFTLLVHLRHHVHPAVRPSWQQGNALPCLEGGWVTLVCSTIGSGSRLSRGIPFST